MIAVLSSSPITTVLSLSTLGPIHGSPSSSSGQPWSVRSRSSVRVISTSPLAADDTPQVQPDRGVEGLRHVGGHPLDGLGQLRHERVGDRDQEDDRLGEVLLKAGKITFEQYNESGKMLRKKFAATASYWAFTRCSITSQQTKSPFTPAALKRRSARSAYRAGH